MKNTQTTQNLALIKKLKKELAVPEAPATKEQIAEAEVFIDEAQAFIAAGKGTLADFQLLKAAQEKAQLPEEKCTHDFIAREYTSQRYGTCLDCGETIF